MKNSKRRAAPLPWRVAGNALLLVVMLSVFVGALQFSTWKLSWEVRTAMEENGANGPGRLLWEGTLTSYGETVRSILRQADGQLYLGQLSSYEGRPYIHVHTGTLPEGPEVSLMLSGAADFFPWRAHGGTAGLLIGVSLPEETAGGKLTVTLGPEVIRETEGIWDQELLFFQPPLQWVEYEWGLKKDGIRPYHTGTLADRPYTLTLWDENRRVISETTGNLGSIWGR